MIAGSIPLCDEIEDSSSSLSSPGNRSAEVKELRRALPCPVRTPAMPGGVELAIRAAVTNTCTSAKDPLGRQRTNIRKERTRAALRCASARKMSPR